MCTVIVRQSEPDSVNLTERTMSGKKRKSTHFYDRSSRRTSSSPIQIQSTNKLDSSTKSSTETLRRCEKGKKQLVAKKNQQKSEK